MITRNYTKINVLLTNPTKIGTDSLILMLNRRTYLRLIQSTIDVQYLPNHLGIERQWKR